MSDPDLPTDVDFVRVGYGSTVEAVMRRRADLGVVVTGAAQSEGTRPLLIDDELVGVVRHDHQRKRLQMLAAVRAEDPIGPS